MKTTLQRLHFIRKAILPSDKNTFHKKHTSSGFPGTIALGSSPENNAEMSDVAQSLKLHGCGPSQCLCGRLAVEGLDIS